MLQSLYSHTAQQRQTVVSYFQTTLSLVIPDGSVKCTTTQFTGSFIPSGRRSPRGHDDDLPKFLKSINRHVHKTTVTRNNPAGSACQYDITKTLDSYVGQTLNV